MGLFLDLEQQSVVTAVTEKKLLQFNKNANFFFHSLQLVAIFGSFHFVFSIYILFFFCVCPLPESVIVVVIIFYCCFAKLGATVL